MIVAIPPTNDGDQLFVMLTGPEEGGTVGAIAAGAEYVSLDLGGLTPTSCDRWAWTWHSTRSLPAGIANVSLTMSTAAQVSGYILAFSGLSHEGLSHDFAFRRASFPAKAPALAAGSGNVVLSMVGTCGSVGDLADGPFTGLPPADGIAIAYYVPEEPGAFGATWSGTGDCVSATEILR